MINRKVKEMEFSAIRELNSYTDKLTINLGIGRPYLKTPSIIKNAAIDAIKNDKTFYTSNYGIKELREVISNRYKFGNYENALITVGAAEAIYTTMMSFLYEGDEVLIPNPGYLAYEPIAKILSAKPVLYELNDTYQIDFIKLEKLITKKTTMIIINHPGNPTGVEFSKKSLNMLIEIANKNNIVIVSDEVYQGLNYSNETIFSLADLALTNKIVVISSLSKEYSMTGFRIGWIYTNSSNINQLVKPHLYINSCATTISQYAALCALKENPREVVNKLKENKSLMKNYLTQIKNIKFIESNAGLYYFIDVSYFGDDKVLTFAILKEINLLVIFGSAFGSKGKGYIRLSFGAKPSDIENGMKKLMNFLNSLERNEYAISNK
ncbi:MAG: pyridoxal phosphate-dependent aminotransferase [Bacillota bacterium]|nr:pyridoxal phosphate-dependent aminotransferase [Bacillota bacterium]